MNMPVFKVQRQALLSQLVKFEAHPDFCRETTTLLAGDGAVRKTVLGTILAMTFAASAIAVAASADAGNTGNGTLTLADPAYTSAVKPGDYTVVCTTGGADATSKFRVEDPLGNQVGTATGGAAFAKQIKFTIAGGGTDFVEGDKFVVSVSFDLGDASNKVVEWDPAAADGTERIWGLALNEVTAPDGEDAEGQLVLRRGPSIVFSGQVQWPDGITDAQKDDAVREFEAMGILVRV
ncbi:head decoration protein [Oricola indica]|jgi:hypothetical protein|uniref:head decoration protein n=1 Tax=Oricola indica TaxID=2872591 RepID=UPI001CBECF44|nr:head decoration protein [Oricola indica]